MTHSAYAPATWLSLAPHTTTSIASTGEDLGQVGICTDLGGEETYHDAG